MLQLGWKTFFLIWHYFTTFTYQICVCVLQFSVDSEYRFFMGIFFIYTHSFCQKSADRKSPQKYVFISISFFFLEMSDLEFELRPHV